MVLDVILAVSLQSYVTHCSPAVAGTNYLLSIRRISSGNGAVALSCSVKSASMGRLLAKRIFPDLSI